MYVHEVSFENGDKGNYSSKTDTCTKFKEGEAAEYTIEFREFQGQQQGIVKPIFTQSNQFGNSKSAGNNSSFALSYSKDVWVSKIAKGETFSSNDCIFKLVK